MADKKRKTVTSTAVKQRYLDKTYTVLSYREHKDIAAAFRKACEEKEIPQAQVLKAAVRKFLNENEEN